MLRTKYMYRLLDYHTWIVLEDGKHVGLVTVNTADRSVTTAVLEGCRPPDLPVGLGWSAWLRWLGEREISA